MLKSVLLGFFTLYLCVQSFAQINSITLSQSSAPTCDSVEFTISGTHACPNDFIIGVSHVVSGSIITLNLNVSTGFCIPPIPNPTFSTSYTLPLSSVPVGTYSINGTYNAISFFGLPTLTVFSCCPFNAHAGSDTSFCDVPTMSLNGNAPPVGATSNWSVFSGSGTLMNASVENATVSNLSYGENKLVWTVTDTACTTTDTVTITNDEPVTTASTETDRIACEDTTTIRATAPLVGKGKWRSLTSGGLVSNSNNPNGSASFIFPGAYEFSWTVTNGTCNSSDTLIIDYSVLDSATVISEMNYVLTSSPAPQYQWYLDGNAIPGATGMSHTATGNGTYSVLASVAGCETGLFSNEIELTTVGFEEKDLDKLLIIAPNPVINMLFVRFAKEITLLEIYDLNGRMVFQQFVENKKAVELDLSELLPSTYLLRVGSTEGTASKKILVN